MTISISIKNLSFHIANKTLLDNISLEFIEPKIIGLLSPNGHGKTTLCRCLATIYPTEKGMIQYYEDDKPLKICDIAYLESNFNLLERKSLSKNIQYFASLYNDFDTNKCQEILNKFGINENDSIDSLSLGNKQLFHLSLTLSRKSKVIILDEPLSNVDVIAKDKMVQMILDNYTEDTYIFIATHHIDTMEKLFDHVIFLKSGKVIINEDADTLRNKEAKSIENIFKDVYSNNND